jgi:beta-xylosidase
MIIAAQQPRSAALRLPSLLARLAALALGLAAAGLVSAAEPPAFVPVLETDFPDPFVLLAGGTFYAYATNTDHGERNVQLASSANLADWSLVKGPDGKPRDAMPELPPWARRGWTWAPEVMKTAGGYLLYFTAKEKKTGLQCVGVAASADPQGPFTSDAAEPLVCQRDLGGTIDASPFRDSDGKLYLYFKNDGNAVRKPVQIWVQPLAPDGLSVAGEAAPLLKPDAAWEGSVIEAPSMARIGETYALFYSANDFGWPDSMRLSPYGIGYATCRTPQGPCTDAPENPLLHSFNASVGCLSGPGHQALFQVGARWFIAFHAWSASPNCHRLDWARFLYVAPLIWKEGKPAVGISLRPAAAKP